MMEGREKVWVPLWLPPVCVRPERVWDFSGGENGPEPLETGPTGSPEFILKWFSGMANIAFLYVEFTINFL